jgi:AcrR family transcriptional regulator
MRIHCLGNTGSVEKCADDKHTTNDDARTRASATASCAWALTKTKESVRIAIRYRMARVKELGKKDWLRAARLALLKGGIEAVKVERLSRDLYVTKGSFYWHFKDRNELLALLLREWEEELRREIIPQLRGRRGRDALRLLLGILVKRVPLGDEGLLPSDAAIFTWAAVSAEVARRVNRAEQNRLRLLKNVIGDPALVEFFYLTWLGFVARGQRIPGSRRRFPQLARLMVELFSSRIRTRRKTGSRKDVTRS